MKTIVRSFICILTAVSGTVAVQAAKPVFTTLYSFGQLPDGQYPTGALTVAPDGTLYGMTQGGGASTVCGTGSACGTIFELKPPSSPGGAWTERVIHSFGKPSAGYYPVGRLLLGNNRRLYGTTYLGGSGSCSNPPYSGCGTVFELAPPLQPGGKWQESVIFEYPSVGYNNTAGLALGPNGSLVGAMDEGAGCEGLPCGTIFQLNPPAAAGAAWTESVVYTFAGYPAGGAGVSALIAGSDGAFYGLTRAGGSNACTSGGTVVGCGTAFRISLPVTPGGAWTETVLWNFGSSSYPLEDLVIGKDGSLYGVLFAPTSESGIFKLTPPTAPGGTWTESLISTASVDGNSMNTTMAIDRNGAIYGVSYDQILELIPPTSEGGAWTQTVLYTDENPPFAGIAPDVRGKVFGTTLYSGSGPCSNTGCGTVFSLKP